MFLIFIKIPNFLSKYGIGKFYPFQVAYRFLINQLISYFKKPNIVVEVQGHKMFLDKKDSLRLSVFGVYEPFITEVVKKVIKKGDIVLDIGANIGYYTLLFAKLVSENGKVIAFEPEPTNFALLEKNVKANGYKNVILVQKAVSNKTGKIKLYLSEDNLGDHRIYDSHDGRQSIELEAIRLDDYFKKYDGMIDFIKIDVEGAEWGVIQGMTLLLKKNRNLKIITEFWPIGLRRFGIEPEEYLKLLIEHGFKIYHLNARVHKIEPITIDAVMQICMGEKFTNLLCLKSRL